MTFSDPQQPASEPRLRTRPLREESLCTDATQLEPLNKPIRNRASMALRIAGLVLPIFILLATVSFFTARHLLRRAAQSALPQIDGALHINGLTAPVTVLRDAHGVPTLRAASIDDLLFAQGYVTAQDRLWQMDMLRRHAAGTLAEVLGSSLVTHDKAQRYLSIASAADAALAALPADQRHSLEQYARGVNAAIASASGHLPVEFRILRYQPAPWTPRDSLLIGLVMFQDLTTRFPDKLAYEAIAAKLKPELLADLYPVGSWRDHPPTQTPIDLTQPHEYEDIPLDESQSKLNRPQPLAPASLIAARPLLAQLSSHYACESCTPGSNNWVVSGAHTTSGKPLLSNDMHLGFTLPGIWYEAALQAPGLHVAGVTLPGMPFIIVGHNDHVAWGFTNMGADLQDLAIEHARGNGAPTEYQTADGIWHPLLHRHELIRVHGGSDVSLDVALTQHGTLTTPIISAIFPGEKRSLSLRWTAYDPAALTIPLYAINSAATGDALVQAFSTWGGPTQNLVYADDQNHIGYHAIGRIPIRGTNKPAPTDPNAPSSPGAQPGLIGTSLSSVPVDALDPVHQWSGAVIPYDSLPHVADPTDGILATANSRITPDGYPFAITTDWASPYRNERIWKQLANRSKLTPADMLALQRDVYSDLDRTVAERLAYSIDHASSVGKALSTKRLRQAADLLRSWNGNVEADSPAAAIVDSARAALWPLILQPQLGDLAATYTWGEKDFAEEQLILHQPARWLPKNFASWDDLLAAAVDKGLIAAHAPSDLTKWSYGKFNPVDIEHPLFAVSPILRSLATGIRVGTGKVPQSGDSSTVLQLCSTFGPSERFTADLSNLDRSTLNLVLGQSGNLTSPYFLDEWPVWSDLKPGGATLLLPFSAAESSKAAQHTLMLIPR